MKRQTQLYVSMVGGFLASFLKDIDTGEYSYVIRGPSNGVFVGQEQGPFSNLEAAITSAQGWPLSDLQRLASTSGGVRPVSGL